MVEQKKQQFVDFYGFISTYKSIISPWKYVRVRITYDYFLLTWNTSFSCCFIILIKNLEAYNNLIRRRE